jgi:hypothetical protein
LVGYKGQLRLTDGGGFDNTGILALLRRKVSKIIACVAMNMSVMDDLQEDANISAFGCVAGLFGTMKADKDVDGMDMPHYNACRQVFPSDQWIPLLTALREKVSAGAPAVHSMKMTVLPNEKAGVPGKHDVEIVFVLNSMPESWATQLPADTKQRLKDDQKLDKTEGTMMNNSLIAADLNSFPFIPLGRLKYSALLVGLLSQLASYHIISHAEEIQAMLAN